MKSLLLALALLTAGAPLWAAAPDSTEAVLLAQRQQAEQWRQAAATIRAEAEATYKQADQACLPKLLVNACRDAARERYLARIKLARDQEIEANRVDAAARTALNARRAANRPPRPPAASAPEAGEPPAGAAPTHPADAVVSSPRGEPPAAPSVAEEAAFAEAKRQRQQRADKARQADAAEARARAAKAQADRARYDARARQIAERRERRAEKATGASPTD